MGFNMKTASRMQKQGYMGVLILLLVIAFSREWMASVVTFLKWRRKESASLPLWFGLSIGCRSWRLVLAGDGIVRIQIVLSSLRHEIESRPRQYRIRRKRTSNCLLLHSCSLSTGKLIIRTRGKASNKKVLPGKIQRYFLKVIPDTTVRKTRFDFNGKD